METLEITVSSKSRIYVGEKYTDIRNLFSPGEFVVERFKFQIEEPIKRYLSAKDRNYLTEFFKMVAYRVIRGLGIDKTPRYQAMMRILRKEDETMEDSLKKLVRKMISSIKKPMKKLHKKMWKERTHEKKLKRAGLTAIELVV